MGSRLAKATATDELINTVAGQDLSIALDMEAMRPVGGGDTNAERVTVISEIDRHIYTHGSSLPLLFNMPFDGDHTYNRNPDPHMAVDTGRARSILEKIPDPDVLAAILAACSVPGNGTVTDPSLWSDVVPPPMADALHGLGDRLRENAITIGSGTQISVRVTLIEDLLDAFPHLGRYHRPGDKVAKVPWLTAYVLAHGCGARLATVDEFKDAFSRPEVQRAALGAAERSDHPNAQMEPMFRIEWLAAPAGMVRGAEFVGRTPPFYERRVFQASVSRSELTFEAQMSLDLAYVDCSETKAEPDRKKLFAWRLAF